jgi:hypothetical protein
MQLNTGRRTNSGHMAGSHWRTATAPDCRGRALASPPSHVPAASWPPHLRVGALGLVRVDRSRGTRGEAGWADSWMSLVGLLEVSWPEPPGFSIFCAFQ